MLWNLGLRAESCSVILVLKLSLKLPLDHERSKDQNGGHTGQAKTIFERKLFATPAGGCHREILFDIHHTTWWGDVPTPRIASFSMDFLPEASPTREPPERTWDSQPCCLFQTKEPDDPVFGMVESFRLLREEP